MQIEKIRIFLLFFFIIINLFFLSNHIQAQNIVIGFGLGYTGVNFSSWDTDMLSIIPEPAIGYELFIYFDTSIIRNFHLLIGGTIISKGFLYSENQKHEIIYLQFLLKLRYLIYRNTESKVFVELGFNLFGQLITDFILNYSNFSISYDDTISINSEENSLNFGTGIIVKNIIFSLNIHIQMDYSYNQVDEGIIYNFSNYCFIFSIGFIL